MAFSAKDVATLRAKTGCGMMDCKKALSQADGDMDKAIDFLREKGLAAATKKAGRIAAEGIAYAVENEAGNAGVVIEVNAENAEFRNFVKTCADTVLANSPADVDALLQCKAAGSDETVDAILKEKILKIGENIKIRRFQKFDGVVGAYIHAEGKIGDLTTVETSPEIAAKPELKAYDKDVCMQMAAIRSIWMKRVSRPTSLPMKRKSLSSRSSSPVNRPQSPKRLLLAGCASSMKRSALLTRLSLRMTRCPLSSIPIRLRRILVVRLRLLTLHVLKKARV